MTLSLGTLKIPGADLEWFSGVRTPLNFFVQKNLVYLCRRFISKISISAISELRVQASVAKSVITLGSRFNCFSALREIDYLDPSVILSVFRKNALDTTSHKGEIVTVLGTTLCLKNTTRQCRQLGKHHSKWCASFEKPRNGCKKFISFSREGP